MRRKDAGLMSRIGKTGEAGRPTDGHRPRQTGETGCAGRPGGQAGKTGETARQARQTRQAGRQRER